MSNHSTGPRTPEGKAVSSQNAFSHGLTSARLVLPGENASEFDQLLEGLIDEHQPAAVTEGILVREMAEQYWRLQRARNREHMLLCQTESVMAEAQENMAIYLGWQKEVDLAQRYATRHERAFHKCLSTLRRLQKERRQRQKEAETADSVPEAQTSATGLITPAAPASNPSQFVSQNAFRDVRDHGKNTAANSHTSANPRQG